ncbi:MAG: hypothetical protein ACTS8P_03785 [Arsenophonus sp. NC-XBC3-MAG3]
MYCLFDFTALRFTRRIYSNSHISEFLKKNHISHSIKQYSDYHIPEAGDSLRHSQTMVSYVRGVALSLLGGVIFF